MCDSNETEKPICCIVVEDELEIRNIEVIILKDQDLNVHEAGTAQEAALLLALPRIDLAVLDYMIPHWIASNYIHRLKQRYKAIKIIMCSAHTDLQEFADSLKIEAVIPKPFSVKDFTNTVREVLKCQPQG